VQYLSAATTQGDLPVPGFANMVHSELGSDPIEVASFSGVCVSGMQALKAASQQILSGEKSSAISCAGEVGSRSFKSTRFESQKHSPGFDTEFLRWMLSGGSGAMFLSDTPNPKGSSLQVEWITIQSYSGSYPLCMYVGKNGEEGKTWLDYADYQTAAIEGAINLRQDVRLLDNMIKLGVDGFFELIDQGQINPKEIDWLV